MSIAEDPLKPVDDALLDRLVDGDLDESDQRDLLIRLENEPDGWRRCSLAFLEDQVWRRAIGGLGAAPAASLPVKPGSPRSRKAQYRAAIAASLIAATFAVGFAVGGVSRGGAPVLVATPQAHGPVNPSAPGPEEGAREIGKIALSEGSGDETVPERVPDERWLQDLPPSVPDHVRALWERQGYQVEERRRMVSLTLQDGRRVSIPVDEVALEYVGQQPL